MRRVARLPFDCRRAFIAALFCAFIVANSASAYQFNAVATVDQTTMTNNQACYWAGKVLECSSTNPTITATGLVGIGTTNPLSALQVAGRETLDDNGGFELMANWVTYGDTYLHNGYAGRIEFLDWEGAWRFETAPNGTAGLTATPTTAMIITNGGSVGIGSTSPVASLDLSQKTDAVALPVGTTGQRPTGVNGMIRYNNTLSALEAYANGAWTSLAGSGALAGSGTTNYVAKWTPNGSTLGIGTLYDDGTNVGIGTTTPDYQLSIASANTGTPVAITFWQGTAEQAYMGVSGGPGEFLPNSIVGDLAIRNGNGSGSILFGGGSGGGYNTFMDINPNGNVGIGTTAPLALFNANAGTGATSTVAGLIYGSTGLGTITDLGGHTPLKATLMVGSNWANSNSSGAGLINAYNSSGSMFWVGNSGNVGIGTTAPAAALDVQATSGDVAHFTGGFADVYTFSSTAAVQNGLNFIKAEGTVSAPTTTNIGDYIGPILFTGYNGTNYELGAGIDAIQTGASGASATPMDLLFETASSSGLAESMRITSAGNVGIGTTAPLAQLSIGSGSIANSSVPVQISTGGSGSAVFYGANVNGSYGAAFGYVNNQSGITGGVIREADSNPLTFQVNNTTNAMTITSTGDVGIGTTSPGSSLQVNGGAAVGYSTSTAAPANGLAVSGNVAIGTTSVPSGEAASINGSVQIAGTGSEVCDTAHMGQMRYNPTGKYMEVCQ